MSYVYYFFVGSPPDIATRVSNLDNKITIDLNLSMTGTYLGTTYDIPTETVEVSFSAELSEPNAMILTNLAAISLYSLVVGYDVYVFNPENFNRYSTLVSSAPGVNHDVNSGYAVSSIVTTTSDAIYICTDNTAGAAVWKELQTV